MPPPDAKAPSDLEAELEAIREVLRAISDSPFDLERVLGIAEPGQIVLSKRVYARVESIVTATPLGQLELKGFRRPVDAYALADLVGPAA